MAVKAGLFRCHVARHQILLLVGIMAVVTAEIFLLVLEAFAIDEPYDFGASEVPAQVAAMAEDLQDYREYFQAPPTDAVFFHRKLGGVFLLANRLGARINVHQLVKRWL